MHEYESSLLVIVSSDSRKNNFKLFKEVPKLICPKYIVTNISVVLVVNCSVYFCGVQNYIFDIIVSQFFIIQVILDSS